MTIYTRKFNKKHIKELKLILELAEFKYNKIKFFNDPFKLKIPCMVFEYDLGWIGQNLRVYNEIIQEIKEKNA